MKKMIIITMVLFVASVFLTGQAFARGGFGKGTGAYGQGQCVNPVNTDAANNPGTGFVRGTGPVINVNDGENIEVIGSIAEIAYYGQGIKIDTGENVITVYGLGPVWYWDMIEASYPVVGTDITVNGSLVTFSDGTQKIVALSVVSGDNEVALRDGDTGYPLWRGQGFGARGNNGSGYPCIGQ